MIEEVRARFRTRFFDIAIRRVQRALASVDGEEAKVAHGELHSLSGEAAMLGFDDIAALSRSGEAAAQRWLEWGQAGARDECITILQQLERTISQVSDGTSA